MAGALGSVALLLIGMLAVITSLLEPGQRKSMQEALIREAVDDSAIAASYELTPTATAGVSNVELTVRLALEPDADQAVAGRLLTTLFGSELDVAAVVYIFGDAHELRANRLERDPAEWTELVTFVGSLEPNTAELTQLGPAGVATYRLDVAASQADPALGYERLTSAERPEWLSFGHVVVQTESGQWPKRTIDAGRPLTEAELKEFRRLDDELAKTLKPDEKYAVSVVTELGNEVAKFDTRVIPALKGPQISEEPTPGSDLSDRGKAPGESSGTGNGSSSPSAPYSPEEPSGVGAG